MDINDQRDYAEEEYNRAEMEREGLAELESERMEAKVNREILRGAVASAITCHISGAVLDMKSAVMVTITGQTTQQTAVYVGSVYDERIAPNIPRIRERLGFTVEVIDGRGQHSAR